jgi:hypothetical protein
MKVREFVINYIALFILLTMTVDALDSNWNLNPIWDLFYSRIQLNLFYEAHAFSILPFCIAAFFMWKVKKDEMATAVFAALGTASIHEICLDINDEIYFRVSSGISPGYALVLLSILGIGAFIACKRYHKNVWAATFVMMTAWFAVIGFLGYFHIYSVGSTIDPNVPFGKSIWFNNPVTNVAEVVSWIAPSSLWFLPRKWFQWKSQP